MKHRSAGWIATFIAALWITPVSAQAPRSPHGHWIITEIANSPVNPRVRTSFDLASNGLVTGSAGCNRYRAKGTRRGGAISFGPAIATKKMCEATAMSQEAAFLAQLPAIRAWRFEEQKLLLLDGAGAVQLRAERLRTR